MVMLEVVSFMSLCMGKIERQMYAPEAPEMFSHENLVPSVNDNFELLYTFHYNDEGLMYCLHLTFMYLCSTK